MRHNRRTNDRPDGKEALHRIHGCGVLRGGCADITNEDKSSSLENADCCSGNREQDEEENKRTADGEQLRVQRKKNQAQNDGSLPSQLVRQITKKESCDRNA